MKTFVVAGLLLSLPIALAGCDKAADAPPTQGPADAVGDMAMPAETKSARGSGTVTAIDPAANRITLDHGPIAELEWPAMEMNFTIEAEKLEGIKVGDAVSFDLQWDGKAGEVTAITKDL